MLLVQIIYQQCGESSEPAAVRLDLIPARLSSPGTPTTGHNHNVKYRYNQIIIHEDVTKDCLLTGQEQACTRITRLFGWLSPCRKWPNTQENGC